MLSIWDISKQNSNFKVDWVEKKDTIGSILK